jgi:hypothetical protein
MRGADLGSREQRAIDRRDLALATLPADGMDAVVERRVAALRRVDAERAGDDGAGEDVLGREQPLERQRRRDLGPVEQRQAFLGLELHRGEAGAPQCVRRRHPHALEEDLAMADQGGAEMRERRQVSRSADRSLRRDHRDDAAVDHVEQRLDHLGPDAGMSAPQARGLEDRHETHRLGRERRSDADAVREHERRLQLAQLVGRDAGGRKLAEAGVHP